MNTTVNKTQPATEKQMAFIARLWAERVGDAEIPALFDLRDRAPHDRRVASYLIDHLLGSPKIAPAVEPTPGATRVVTEGMWTVRGTVYKVQVAVHGSGRLYAKRLVLDEEGGVRSGRFEFAPGGMSLLAREGLRMGLDEAKAWGSLYGCCVRCGATLTNEESIALGIGPVCAAKF